jgi:hypothetical protein
MARSLRRRGREVAEEAGDPLQAAVRADLADVDARERDGAVRATSSHAYRSASLWASIALVRRNV